MPRDDDRELGIDWLTSQLGDPTGGSDEDAAGHIEPAGANLPAEPTVPGEPAESDNPGESGEADAHAAPRESAAVSGPAHAEADLEPARWWTSPVRTPPTPTAEERAVALAGAPVPASGLPGAPAAASAADTPSSADPSSPAPASADSGISDTAGSASEMPPPVAAAAATPPAAAAPPTVAVAAISTPSRHSSGRHAPGGDPGRTATRTLVWVGSGILAAVVLVGLFLLGQRLSGGPAPIALPAPSGTSTATPTPTPTPTPVPAGPRPAGVHKWDSLSGGECLEPFASPWDEEFTVVDCAAPHGAQLVYRGVFPGDAQAAFPGEAALAAQINPLCTAPGVLDPAAAGAFGDLQVQGSYPVTEEQWTQSPRYYYCFVSRSSAEPLTASINGPGPAA